MKDTVLSLVVVCGSLVLVLGTVTIAVFCIALAQEWIARSCKYGKACFEYWWLSRMYPVEFSEWLNGMKKGREREMSEVTSEEMNNL